MHHDIIPALLVIYDEKGKVDEKETRKIIRHCIDLTLDGLYINGSTSENFLLDTQTKKQLLTLAHDEIKKNNSKMKLFAQIGGLNLDESIELGFLAKSLSYTAISAVTPFYYHFSFKEIKNYYKTLAEEVDYPLVIYTIPELAKVSFTMEQWEELLAIKNVVGIKFTDNNFYLLERLRTRFPEMLLYSGRDEMLNSAAVLGINGTIGSTYSFLGLYARTIFVAHKKPDFDQALEAQKMINDIVDLLKPGTFQIEKNILKYLGIIDKVGSHKPFLPLTDEQVNYMLKIAKKRLDEIKTYQIKY